MSKTVSIFLFLTVLACCCPSLAAQGSKRISPEEKKALEKRFQNLNTFYIDNDGTVVFFKEDENRKVAETEKQQKPGIPYVRTKIKVSVNDDGEYVVSSEEVVSATQYAGLVGQDTADADAELDETENDQQSYPVLAGKNKSFAQDKNNKSGDDDAKTSAAEKTTSYKTLEAAMMDVDQLIEELKKLQSQQSGKGKTSLSQRVSSGVDGSLRNHTYELSDYEDFQEPIDTLGAAVELPDGMEGNPTYYINGVLADKKEVDKLRAGDILSKKIKASATNPNGEWWIETRK